MTKTEAQTRAVLIDTLLGKSGWNVKDPTQVKVLGFPTRDDLERFQYIRRNRKPLTQELINTAIAGRDYQIRAIRAVLELSLIHI